MLYHVKEPIPGARVIEPERVVFTDEGLHYETDVVYGQVGETQLLMDYFFPKAHAGKLPAVIWIHGGGWFSRDLTRVYRPEREMVELAKLGFFCASIDYRTSDEAVYPAQVEDCKCAVRFLRANAEKLNIDTEHIGVWGESAGAHLAALMAVTNGVKALEGNGGWADASSSVQACVPWYAPMDLAPLHTYYGRKESIVTMLLGVAQDSPEFAQKAAEASPMYYAAWEIAPMLVMHGDRDSIVPYGQSEAFVKKARAAGNPVRIITVHDQGHGFFQGSEYEHAIENFFCKELQGVDRGRFTHEGEGGHVVWEHPLDWDSLDIDYRPDQVYDTIDGIELKADWMIPRKHQKKMPVVVWFHGGGWQAEDLNRLYRPDRLLAALCGKGFAVISADYRLLQQAAYPAPIQDARCVIRYVRACAEKLDLDAAHIGVMGESAGAATAQLLGVGKYLPEHEGNGAYCSFSSEVQAVCSWYGFSNYIKQAELTGMEQNHFLKVNYDIDGEGSRKLYRESTISYADRPLPPFLLLHGSADPLVPRWQSEDMYHELVSWGNEAELYIVPGQVHGFFSDAKSPELIQSFFIRHLMK